MKSFVREIYINPSSRLDKALREAASGDLCFLSRNSWKTLFSRGLVTDGQGRKLRAGMEIREPGRVLLSLPSEQLGILPFSGSAESSEEVYFENDSYIVFNKRWGVPSVPLHPWESGTVVNQIYSYFLQKDSKVAQSFAELSSGRDLDAGLVQRLDNSTSGLLVAAKDAPTKRKFRDMISSGSLWKRYLAIVEGNPTNEGFTSKKFKIFPERNGITYVWGAKAGTVAEPSSRHLESQFTEFELSISYLAQGGGHSLVELTLNSGERHIVRATMASLGNPLAGDALYSSGPDSKQRSEPFPEFHLHASHLSWKEAGEEYNYAVQPPIEFRAFCRELGIEFSFEAD